MKAQAKKILALIMAMVMCLSLAAPAFAGTYKEPDAGTNAVGTWTYVNAADSGNFTAIGPKANKNAEGFEVGTVAADQNVTCNGEALVIPKDTKILKKSTTDANKIFYLVDNKVYTLNDADITKASTATEVTIDAPSASEFDAYKENAYLATKTFATRIDASANDGTYKVMGFRANKIYADVDTATGGDQLQEEMIASGDVKKGKDNQPANVDMGTKKPGTDLIGKPFESDSYPVTYDNDTNAPTGGVVTKLIANVPVAVAKGNSTLKAIDDVTTGWATLAEGQTFKYAGDGKDYQVKGTVYQESQGTNGLVNVYFKLKVVENESFTSDELYFVNKSGVAPIAEGNVDDMATALAGATQCDNFGKPKDGGKDVKAAGCALEVTRTAARPTHYAISVINENDVAVKTDTKTVKAGSNTATTDILKSVTVSDDKETGSFQMSLKNETAEKKADHFFVTDLTEATELITALFADATTNCTLVSVEAASGNYFTVNVKRSAVSTAYSTSANAYGKNVFFYTVGTSPNDKKTALLVDLSVGGQYNATNKEGANAKVVEAGTEALGPVIVKKSDVDKANYNVPADGELATNFTAATASFRSAEAADAPNDNYYYFSSVKDMKAKITAKNCKNAKSIPYVQVVLNPYNGDKQNKLVVKVEKTRKVNKDTLLLSGDADAVSKNIVTDMFAQQDTCKVELAKDWDTNAFATPYADFVKKGTLDVAAAAHGDTVDIVEQVDATCKQKGKKITKTTCKICNTVISEKTEEIPVVTDPVETNTGVEVEDANGEKVKKIWFDQSDPDEKKGSATGKHTPHTGHFITKAVTTTTVSEDKKSSVVTTEFYCNHGELQPQLTRVVNVTKIGLQHSGNWNLFKLDGRSSLIYDNDDVWNMFGYDGVTIIDSDVENANLPMNRKKADIPDGTADTDTNGDIVLTFGKNVFKAAGSDSNKAKEDDGTWVAYTAQDLKSVYATANSLPETKWYAAKLTVKDVKERTARCQAGSGVIEVDVYDVSGIKTDVTQIAMADALNAINSNATLAKNLKEGKVVLKQHFSQNVEMRPISNHSYDEVSGVCFYCNKTREAVESATFTADTIAVENLKWTGNKVQPKVTVMNTKGEKLLKGVDYLVEQIEDTDAGEYTITVVGQDDYKGNRVTVPFTIEKVAATLKKKSAPSKLTASATKKVTGQIKMTVKGGKVSAYKVTGKVSGVSVNKSGKITVKKGNKKAGTLKVKVSMKADKNHTAAKAVTVKVAIKAAPAAKKTTKKK